MILAKVVANGTVRLRPVLRFFRSVFAKISSTVFARVRTRQGRGEMIFA